MLAQAIYREGIKNVTAGANPMELKRGIDQAVRAAVEALDKLSKPVEGKDIAHAAVEAARTRFRPILMTSFAFILGVVPLVTATGAGANSRISLGLCVFSGMIASTCLAVLFVPSFFTVLQRFEERKKKAPKAPPAEVAAASP